MSDFSSRKKPIISVDPDAKSKKMEETLNKLSAVRAGKNQAGILPSFSARDVVTSQDKQERPEIKNLEPKAKSGSGSGLRMLRITTTEEPKAEEMQVIEAKTEKAILAPEPLKAAPKAEIRANQNQTRRYNNEFMDDGERESVLLLSPKNSNLYKRKRNKIGGFIGLLITAAWLGLSIAYVQANMGWETILSQQPHILGGFIAGIMAPLAFLWMFLAYIQRGADVQMYASALRSELQAMIFPSEERAEVIHKDIESLCAQAAELSASSKTILSSIHKARVGLRNEIRDFSGLSKKTEFHIDRLADSLAQRSAKLLELTDEIERRTSGLDEKTVNGAKAWDEAAAKIINRANEIEQGMRIGAKEILSAAEAADKTTAGINDNIRNSVETLQRSVDSVRNLTEGTVKSITQATQTIEANRDTLSDGAKILAEKADVITNSLNQSVSAIQGSIEEIVSKTDNLEERLSNRVSSLGDILGDMDGKIIKIENIGDETANKLSEAMVSALSGADNIGDSVRRAIETLSKATHEAKMQAEEIMQQASDKVDDINKSGKATAENIGTVLELINTSRDKMQEASQMVDTQVEKLVGAVETQSMHISRAQDELNERVEAIQLSMTAPLTAMSQAVDNASEKHSAIEEVLSKRVAELNLASDKALENAKIIREDLRTQAQEISTLVGQIAGHSRSVQSLMNSQREDLSQNVDDVLERVELVGQKLQSQSDQLTNVAQRAEENIGLLKGSLSSQCDEVTSDTGRVINELKDLDSIIEQKVRTLVEKSSQAKESVEQVTTALTQSADVIEPIYTSATNQIDQTRERFERMSLSFEEGTDSNLDKLKSMGILFDERLQTLTTSAEDAARVLDKSGENLSGRVDDIESATKAASDRIQEMERLFKKQASDIHMTTDQAMLRIENIQKALNDQFHDLTISVGESVAQIQDAGDQFMKQAQHVKAVSEEAATRYDETGKNAEEQTYRLKQLAKTTAEQMEDVIKRVQIEAKELLNTSGMTLSELKKSGDSFALRAKEIEEQMKISLLSTRKYGDTLGQQADEVAEMSSRAVDNISGAISALAGRMQDVNKAAGEVQGKIEKARSKLEAETEYLADVSIKAAKVVDEAAASYIRQSHSLFKATEDAASHAKKIRETDWRLQRESFMNSAKFVLESMHSLSVDLTRMVDGDIPEKTWKSYQKGDIAAFTKRLIEKRDRIPVEKMRHKFANDNEFRTYLTRFIRQFEEVYEQADANDHGELLSTIFASSDVGGLYEILCDIADRQSLIRKKLNRAA